MDTDLALIMGLFVCTIGIPGVVSAISESRAPRAAAIAVLVGGGLLIYAVTNKHGGYQFSEIPDVLFRVVGRYLH